MRGTEEIRPGCHPNPSLAKRARSGIPYCDLARDECKAAMGLPSRDDPGDSTPEVAIGCEKRFIPPMLPSHYLDVFRI